jgi:hypothetical protein
VVLTELKLLKNFSLIVGPIDQIRVKQVIQNPIMEKGKKRER